MVRRVGSPRDPVYRLLSALLLLITASCGGGGSDGGGTSYAFVAPVVSSKRAYAETILDNAHNTINLSYTETVTAVNPDGSYTVLQEDPNHESVIVNNTNYSIVTGTVAVNNSGQETGYTYADSNDATVSCTFTPHGAGPDFPITIGMTWTLNYSFGCGTQPPVSYVQSGSVVDVESITVPAGTYRAIKLQSTLTWTDAQGTTRTETVTNWRDAATSVSVKQSITISYSGTLPTRGYAISEEIVLESMS